MFFYLPLPNMQKRLSMTDDEAKHVLGYVNKSGRYKFSSQEEWKEVVRKRTDYRNQEKEVVSLRMSALTDDGELMDIDQYSSHYGIPRGDIKSYKLVSHTSIPYYNIQSNNIEEEKVGFDIYTKVDELIKSYTAISRIASPEVKSNVITQLVFSDTHIGMDNSGGLYGGKWDRKSIMKRCEVIASAFIQDTPDYVDCIQIINCGDYADGLDGYTTRRDHKLPQNMSNEEVFDLGVEFLTTLLEYILQNKKANKIIFYNVCNSNHSSSFDYFICQAFKGRFVNDSRVEIINERDFIGHFSYGGHDEVITHGKDSKDMKFGFTPQLNAKVKEKINNYISYHRLNGYVTLHKGDSHVFSKDKCDEFDYISYLAVAPSSSWCQVNFNRGRSGFAINQKCVGMYSGSSQADYEFQWNENNLR